MEYNISDLILIILLFLAVYFDITARKIPNKITVPALLYGMIWSTLNSGLQGFKLSILGILIGFAVFLVPYIFNGIGAGDVKLMTAIGAIMGWEFILKTSLSTALVGGIIVVIYMLYKKGLVRTLVDTLGILVKPLMKILYMISGFKIFYSIFKYFDDLKTDKKKIYIPYAIPIAIGSISVMLGLFKDLLSF